LFAVDSVKGAGTFVHCSWVSMYRTKYIKPHDLKPSEVVNRPLAFLRMKVFCNYQLMTFEIDKQGVESSK